MVKEQKRGNREVNKPKQDKKAAPVADPFASAQAKPGAGKGAKK